jgi:hypothetical protein
MRTAAKDLLAQVAVPTRRALFFVFSRGGVE